MPLIRTIAFLIAACLLAGCKTVAPLDAYQGLSDQQIFQRGEQNLKKGHYEQAVKDLEALDTLYPFGQYSQQGQLDIVNAYYKSDDNDSALAAADRYIRLYPRADNVDFAYYMKGIINAGSKDNWFTKWMHATPAKLDVSSQQDALDNFSTLTDRYPNSQFAPEAHRRMVELRNLIAQHEIEIAQYYMRHKTYVAAANRAVGVLVHYQGSPQVPVALGIMVESYRALAEPTMADNALQVLMKKYPDSKQAKKLSAHKV